MKNELNSNARKSTSVAAIGNFPRVEPKRQRAIRERVSFQTIPNSTKKNRDCAFSQSVRRTRQNRVPKPADDMEEG
ncbi:hypothetical protein TNCT_89101 [Trichonephila clavata]|uniref:Uncharacterized protein n=1 Tax=Trichonephila clavata TaxID=2740835 RepID=A0A8X6K5J6_TRICU|nr:hypothetical protein TNCT_89101 [Trichonephila clavata]